MFRRGIALMNVEAIPGIALVVFAHNPVTEDLGQDGRRGNGTRKPVAVNHGPVRNEKISPQVPIDQQKIRRDQATRSRPAAKPSRVAPSTFSESISASEATPIPHAVADSVMNEKSASRFVGFTFFESSRLRNQNRRGTITAAPTTGPAKGPRPASSNPATRR